MIVSIYLRLRWVFIYMYLCLYASVYLYIFISISPTSLEFALEYSGKKIMIRFIKRRFPGCIYDSRQVCTWHGFWFSQQQQFQYPHDSARGGFYINVLLVGFLKCLGLPCYAYKMLMVVCLGLKKPKGEDHLSFSFPHILIDNQYLPQEYYLTSWSPKVP